MCCSRPAKHRLHACRDELAPRFVSRHGLFPACRAPGCSDSAAGGRHRAAAACVAIACPCADCLCHPLKVTLPASPRSITAAAQVEEQFVCVLLTWPGVKLKGLGILMSLCRLMLSFTSQTSARSETLREGSNGFTVHLAYSRALASQTAFA